MYKSSVRAIYVNSHTNISGVIADEKVAKVPRPHRNLVLCVWDSKATYYNIAKQPTITKTIQTAINIYN